MKKIFLYLLFSFFFIISFAQKSDYEAALKKTNPNPVVIPFQLHRKIIIVQATADKQTGNFIFDTGVDALTLNNRYFKGFETDKTFYDVNGNPSKVTQTFVDLQMGDWKLRQEHAEITDFAALERTLRMPIIGSIGVRAFKKCELVLDYIFQELTIYQLDKAGNRTATYALHEDAIDTLYFKSDAGMPIILVTLGEQGLWLALDTGAGINAFNETLQKKLAPYTTALGYKNLTGVNSQMQHLAVAQIRAVRVGKLPCEPMRTVFAPMSHFNYNLTNIDGILGYEFLSQFRVAINFRKNEIYLWNKEIVEQQLAMRREKKD